jgi:hypothetical protein
MFKDGIHWNWLYTAANPNLIPRPSINRGVEVKRYDIVLLAEQLQPNMITLIGRHNEYWRDSFIEVSHRLTNELTMLRLDMDVIERKGDKK